MPDVRSDRGVLSLRRVAGIYRTFGPFLKPYWWLILLAYGALGLGVLMTLARPWPLKLILDSVLLDRVPLGEALPGLPDWLSAWSDYTALTALCAALVGIVLLESLFGYLQKVLFSSVGHGATTDVLEYVFTHLQTLPKSGGGEGRTGDLVVRLTGDVKTIRDLLVNHVQKLGTYALTFVSTIAVMAWMNWSLTLMGMAVVPLIYVASHRFAREIRSTASRKRRQEGVIASIVQETLLSIPVVQAFGQEDEERQRFRREARRHLKSGVESARLGGAFSRSVKVMSTVGTAVVLWFGASRVLEGTLTPGDLVVFAAYLTELYLPIQNIAELSVQFVEALVSGERVLDVIETAPRIQDRPGAKPAPPFRGELSFEGVVFGYRPGEPVLDNLSFTARPGETVAIVGGSGSGKSTIVNLLLRFFDPWDGRIRIDGKDIACYTLKSLRAQISVVMQDVMLLRRTVRENIAYGNPEASLEEIKAAAQAARAHAFIEQLPAGYETLLDEDGANLSGGQRRRLALARAFLRNAPILVLDEPASGLDPATEMQVGEALEELTKGKTTILIEHRLSTVERADIVLVLDRGKVVQRGTPEELRNRPGAFLELSGAGPPKSPDSPR